MKKKKFTPGKSYTRNQNANKSDIKIYVVFCKKPKFYLLYKFLFHKEV